MEFRPCIDIHNGKVKQIVGGSLSGSDVQENFVAEQSAAYFAGLYQRHGLKGGHVIILDPRGSAAYEDSKEQALSAFLAYPGTLQAGGGITPDNAREFLDAGASHVIVTSYVFYDGKLDEARLGELVSLVGRDKLVLDLSCRKGSDGRYYIVTDRWQRFTSLALTYELLKQLSSHAAEFLVHAVDVEGKQSGIEEDVLKLLAGDLPVPVTYAGGIRDMADIEKIRVLGCGRVNYTVGSALDIFGGGLSFSACAGSV